MPIYMDRHDVSNEITAESVAILHLEDLKIQHKYNCRGLTYWFDDKRKTAFCLVEAPNAESVHNMHQHAHGQLPHSIIEVDAGLVASFLGRMEDPDTSIGSELTVIDEPAFRFLLTVQIQLGQLSNDPDKNLARGIKDFMQKVINVIEDMQGIPVRQGFQNILGSFTKAQNAVDCGLELNSRLKRVNPLLRLSIGLEAGLPVVGIKTFFEDTIQTSRRLCEMGRDFSVSSSVLKIYEEEARGVDPKDTEITKIKTTELDFFHKFFDYLEANFSNSELKIDAFVTALGYSRSQVYRSSINLFGCSPNVFLNRYRLKKSLEQLANTSNTVSDTAFLSGFSSASYFSKCFRNEYGISPKAYMKAVSP